MDSRVGFIAVLVFVVSMSVGVERARATDYFVGDNYGWDVPPNNSSDYYPSWAARYEFKVGDSVVFNWTGNHTAMEVTEAGYNTCNKADNLTTLIAEAGVSVPLTSAGTRYFICSVGTHCEQGQKVAINVTDTSSAVTLTTMAMSDLPVVISALALVISCVLSY